MHDTPRYGLKEFREKVRQEARPREERRRGIALIEWERLGFCLIFT